MAAFVPGAGVGAVLLVAALVFGGRGLGGALFLGGATYVGAVAATGHGIDARAPLVAVLLFLSGELAAWSFDERWGIQADTQLAWRRGGVVAILALAGLAVAAVVVALSAVPSNHGLAWTVVGGAAAISAAGTGIWVTRH
jgi:hypothetical protein